MESDEKQSSLLFISPTPFPSLRIHPREALGEFCGEIKVSQTIIFAVRRMGDFCFTWRRERYSPATKFRIHTLSPVKSGDGEIWRGVIFCCAEGKRFFLLSAETARVELARVLPLLAFQASALDHYATSPHSTRFDTIYFLTLCGRYSLDSEFCALLPASFHSATAISFRTT